MYLGKSTQVPQFLLDANPACNIAVTQPRRISAISIAERIAEEQCQSAIGGLIGYQVRLDSAVSNDTQLVFMTPGILLRKMQSSPQLTEYTHIIVDEIHERDKYQEFLMIVLRDVLPLRPDLRVILMSATLQTDSLVEYFESFGQPPAVVEMEGRMFPVQEYFLELVLEMTGYIDGKTAYDGAAQMNLERELAKLTGVSESQNQQVANVSMKCVMCGMQNFASSVELGEHIATCTGFLDSDFASFETGKANVRAESDYADYDIDETMEIPNYDSIAQSTKKSSDAPTSKAEQNLPLSQPADSDNIVKWDGQSLFAPVSDPILTSTQQSLLDKYQTMHDDETIDHYLLLEIVRYIVKSSFGDGGILIFLPGWQEISEFQRLLESTAPFYDRAKFLVLPLHSGIPSRDQRRVLQPPPNGVRKIVLSTNIAETSLTIEDCAFVIGKFGADHQQPYTLVYLASLTKSMLSLQTPGEPRKRITSLFLKLARCSLLG
jgi:ATP-dependent RNA helicase DHX36